MSDRRVQQTSSGGGPIIGVPAELAAAWRGTLPPVGAVVPEGWQWGDSNGPVCDYDRACDDVEDQVSVGSAGFGGLPLGDGLALVFEGESTTHWVPTPEGGAVLRNRRIDSIADGVLSLTSVPSASWTRWDKVLTLRDGRIFFFDSAAAGAQDPAEIAADYGVAIGAPGPGRYAIWTAVDDDDGEWLRLTRV